MNIQRELRARFPPLFTVSFANVRRRALPSLSLQFAPSATSRVPYRPSVCFRLILLLPLFGLVLYYTLGTISRLNGVFSFAGTFVSLFSLSCPLILFFHPRATFMLPSCLARKQLALFIPSPSSALLFIILYRARGSVCSGANARSNFLIVRTVVTRWLLA